MTVYGDAINTAFRILLAKGQTLTIRQPVGGTFDPVTQVEVGATVAESTTVGAILPKGTTRAFRGDTTLRYTNEAIVSAKDVATRPAPGGSITDANGLIYAIKDVKDLAPDGTDIIWTVALEI